MTKKQLDRKIKKYLKDNCFKIYEYSSQPKKGRKNPIYEEIYRHLKFSTGLNEKYYYLKKNTKLVYNTILGNKVTLILRTDYRPSWRRTRFHQPEVLRLDKMDLIITKK